MKSDHYDDILKGAKLLREAEAWRDGQGTICKQGRGKQGSENGNDEAIEVIGLLLFVRRGRQERTRERTRANGEEMIELSWPKGVEKGTVPVTG